ncbi:glycosyltransferase [Granulosicoccus sp.]|nr:glycosyltransferase [Granulosicoccus sp.]MDB4222425.1 glycosyltransferase [Granulosicoccus sp.]
MSPCVLLVHANYFPKTGPGVNRVYRFAEALAEVGMEPVLLTSDHGNGRLVSKWWCVDNPQDKERLIASKQKFSRRRTQSSLNKLAALVTPMESNLMLSRRRALLACKKRFGSQGPGMIYATGAPLTSLLVAQELAHHFGCPFIIDLRDPWCENPTRFWPSWLHYRWECRLEKNICSAAAGIIMNTPQARMDLLKKHRNLSPNRVHVISHGFDGDFSSAANGEKVSGKACSIRVAYAGGFYHNNSIKLGLLGRLRAFLNFNPIHEAKDGLILSSNPNALFQAIAIHNSEESTHRKVIVDFIGGNADLLMPFVKAHALSDYINILPRIETHKVPAALAEYDLLYLTHVPVSQSPFVATKTFEYLSSGVPIIANLPTGDNAELIIRTGAGWLFGPDDYQAIAELLQEIACGRVSSPCGNVREDIIKCFQRNYQQSDFVKIVERTIAGKSAGPIISDGYRLLYEKEEVLDNMEGGKPSV